jgi:hypothetical protein
MNESLVTSLNRIREVSSTIYHQYIPELTSESDIGKLAQPVLSVPEVYNEFCNALINRIVYTQFLAKAYRNPFVVLEGDALPLGYAGQEVYVNPTKGRVYNPEDFAGLLIKYEADVKVQYTAINMDVQYPVTFSRQQLKKAFTSWGDLETFIENLSNSLYNGAYIDEYNATKQLISGAFKDNLVQYVTVSAVNSEANARAFVTKARELFLQFQTPSSAYNAWSKVGGEGRPVVTWTNPEDVVFIVRNDIRAYMDVNVLASAFNMDKAELLGNILTINDFDIYAEDGTKIYDGSGILGMIADKSWFRIRRQDMFMDSFYNANNRSIQYYLNNIKMYNMSLFANGVVIATSAPTVATTTIKFKETSPSVVENAKITLHIETTPFQANDTITFSSGTEAKATVTKIDNRTVEVTGVDDGTSVITATNGTVSGTVTVTVTAAA